MQQLARSSLFQGVRRRRALEVMLHIWEPLLSILPVKSTYLVTSRGPTVLHLRAATPLINTWLHDPASPFKTHHVRNSE